MSSKLKMTSLHKLKLLVLFSSCSVCCCLLLLVGCKMCTFISRPFIKAACFTTFLAVSHFPFHNRESNKIQSTVWIKMGFNCHIWQSELSSFQVGEFKIGKTFANKSTYLKFSFSEKATKIWSYHPLDLTFT